MIYCVIYTYIYIYIVLNLSKTYSCKMHGRQGGLTWENMAWKTWGAASWGVSRTVCPPCFFVNTLSVTANHTMSLPPCNICPFACNVFVPDSLMLFLSVCEFVAYRQMCWWFAMKFLLIIKRKSVQATVLLCAGFLGNPHPLKSYLHRVPDQQPLNHQTAVGLQKSPWMAETKIASSVFCCQQDTGPPQLHPSHWPRFYSSTWGWLGGVTQSRWLSWDDSIQVI